MAHVRQQVRERIGTLLTGLTTTGTNVFESRVYPISESNLPGLLIYTKAETVEYTTLLPPRILERKLTVTVEIFAKAAAGFDDVLDQVSAEIEAAVYSDLLLNGLARDAEITAFDADYSGDGDFPLARGTVDITVTYLTTEGLPQTAI